VKELFVRDEGQGEAVVLVHGMGASHRVFDEVIEAGAPQRRFLAVDLPRNGQSGRWAESTPRAIAKGLIELLREREVERFRIFGHSFGGLVAAELAAEVPERVISLTLASAPAMGVPVEAGLFLAHPAADFGALLLTPLVGLKPVLRTYLQWLWGEPSRMPDAHLEHYLAAVRTPGFADALMDSSRAMAGYRLPHAALSRGTFPRRVLWGERDPLVPRYLGEELAKSLGAECWVLPKVGHCVPEEAPEAVLRSIVE
jgi:pimeloyl-ACP methyl ester carboxylesterase